MKTPDIGLATVFLMAAVAASSCSDSEGDYEAACDAQCSCAPCSEAGLQDCYDNARESYEYAVETGCQAEAEASSACIAEHTVCEGGLPDLDDPDACDDVAAAREACTSRQR